MSQYENKKNASKSSAKKTKNTGKNNKRKPRWNAGKTKSVRLPELLVPEILELARILDSCSFEAEKIRVICQRAEAKVEALQEVKISTVKVDDPIVVKNSVTENFGTDNFASDRFNDEDLEQEADLIDPVEFVYPEEANSKRQPQLTTDQAQALDRLKQFVDYSQEQYFRLTGYAGTGKSFLLVELMKWLHSQHLNFVAASPTNKAIKNLRKLALQAQISIEACTVAQLLGQQPVINETTGKEEFVSRRYQSIDTFEVVLIDEFSMLSKDNFKEIQKAINRCKTKVIFVGDVAQLPPVGETEPIVASYEGIKSEATLRTIVRYDGEIVQVAEQIRQERIPNRQMYPFQTTQDGTVTCLSRTKWLAEAIALFASEEFQRNPDHVRFLVWRNRTATMLNGYVRSKLWGSDAPAYVIGDRLIAKTPVFRLNPDIKGKNKWQIIMNNSEECEVTDESTMKISQLHGWEYAEVPARTDDGLKITLRILSHKSVQEREYYLRQLKEKKQWRNYYDTFKLFDNVPYAYAITTHKAQGSSLDYVFPDISDMKYSPDLNKLLYTALTRAKLKAFIPYS